LSEKTQKLHKSPGAHLADLLRFTLDPWQNRVLESPGKRLILNCCRQAGKSTVVALLAMGALIFEKNAKVVVVSRSYRQARVLFQMILDFYERLGAPLLVQRNQGFLGLKTGSRMWSLPCKEETIRGYSGVTLLIVDEAARVPEDVYKALRPMLAATNGKLVLLSTPFGKRGFFFKAWMDGSGLWDKYKVVATEIDRISPEFLAEEKLALGESWYRQEYMCSFESVEGLVYPRFAECAVAACPAPVKSGGAFKRVGGIDFGYRNPFAAVWGCVHQNGVLWITDEHFCREKPLQYHADRLPRDVQWYADPAGASDIAALRAGGFKVFKATNSIRPGLSAVQARIESGRLRVLDANCPNLLEEAGLYRYGSSAEGGESEVPVDEYNHALGALRYLVMGIDGRRLLARPCRPRAEKPGDISDEEAARRQKVWSWWRKESLWERLC
jgi:Terminase large subunit, T4likevirus-type, N-terminal